ncbi:MAG TPA: hypothetical protein VK186_05695 [Candidatus Deferrimicrobium sp.]|nr:hypothetical protein [Candidatus Deferrimicrobium sp.]
MNNMKTIMIIVMVLFGTVTGFAETITLKTADLNECIEISNFLSNTKGEIFLYSGRMSKIFKFKQNGEFEKSYCRNGIGPGEVKRALWLYYNPVNNYLYLPEVSSSVPRISIFDCEGNFKNYLDIELSPTQKDHIFKMIFLEDGSFYVTISERIGWEPHGDVYLTKDKLSLLYFDKSGKLKATIFEITRNDEMSNAPRWGGPGILFSPSHIIKSTSDGNICIGKTDENKLQFFDKSGAKLGTTNFEMEPMLLSDSEFEAAQKESIKYFERDLRMQGLAKKMIKLKYKPIYKSFYIYNDRYVFVDFIKENAAGYIKETMLTVFDKKGKKQSNTKVNGAVMNIINNRLYIKEYDEDGNEFFRIEDSPFPLKKK